MATLQRSDEVMTAAQLMRLKHIGYVVVVDPGSAGDLPRLVGVVTDCDIVIMVVARDT